MNFHEYVKLAIRTESKVMIGSKRNTRIAHAALGLTSELSELFEASIEDKPDWNRVEELGDLCWYLAIICDELGIADEHLIPGILQEFKSTGPQFVIDGLVVSVGQLANEAKRMIFYQAPPNYVAIVNATRRCLAALCTREEFELILVKNIRKLAIRYPDGFTDVAAQIRDLESEIKVLAE